MITAGIDAGSRAIKVALTDATTLEVLSSAVTDQGVEQDRLATDLFHHVLDKAGVRREAVKHIVATGYGRDALAMADTTITEITCHARGVHHSEPTARTVIDIGGQDSKVLRLGENGAVRDFAMNDRCAAGTGRFLEVVAQRLGVALHDLGELAARATCPAEISSMCVVFAETEIVGLLSSGSGREDIAAGVQTSIARRVTSMAGRKVAEPVFFTGGVAMVPGMCDALAATLGRPVTVVKNPQMTGAIGAAVLAAETVERAEGRGPKPES